MEKQKSDTRKFLETMWIMVKYDVLPFVIGAGLFALFVIKLQDIKGKNVFDNDKIEKVLKSNSQNSR